MYFSVRLRKHLRPIRRVKKWTGIFTWNVLLACKYQQLFFAISRNLSLIFVIDLCTRILRRGKAISVISVRYYIHNTFHLKIWIAVEEILNCSWCTLGIFSCCSECAFSVLAELRKRTWNAFSYPFIHLTNVYEISTILYAV